LLPGKILCLGADVHDRGVNVRGQMLMIGGECLVAAAHRRAN